MTAEQSRDRRGCGVGIVVPALTSEVDMPSQNRLGYSLRSVR
jgi:hypothetical protein